ncbi:erythromycin esterase family protein [Embleya sp. NPDC005971]|uniref:erythromycin esterase family protein n=1 Tax=Embleya sp. NPDC005971 TaxID=3156724 RepID=UPI0033D7DD7D
MPPVALCPGTLGPAASAGAATPEPDPARALRAGADRPHSTESGAPDADLRAVDRMIGAADLVGVGEATYGSAEFVAVKDHLFRHLVRTKGFTTFALEAAWSTGVRLGEWVRGGPEDLGRIMDADMSRWMRKYNRTQDDRELRIVRNDVAYAGPAQVDTITAYVACHSPVLLPEIQRLYRDRDRESRPTAGMGEAVDMYQRLPLADRRRMRDNVVRGCLRPCCTGTRRWPTTFRMATQYG